MPPCTAISRRFGSREQGETYGEGAQYHIREAFVQSGGFDVQGLDEDVGEGCRYRGRSCVDNEVPFDVGDWEGCREEGRREGNGQWSWAEVPRRQQMGTWRIPYDRYL